jgi:ATP-dependent Zn protease
VPRLEDLPLGAEVASWSFSLLDQLRRVDARVLAPSELSYAILFGPPGTGKTLLVSALARSANWRLVQTSVGSWFSESDGYLGGVSKRITGFFDDLLGATSSIGFIDEVEAIPNRMALGPKDREYWTPVVTLLLLQIDRLRRSGRPVLLLSATNFLERLDPAITRSGRLERHVPVLPPRSLEEVSAVLKHHLGGALDTSTIKAVARLSKGKTPADIEALVRTARSAAAAAGRSLEASDLMSVLVPSDPRDPVELRATALHEAGHAVVALAMSHEIEGASIIAEGKTGGSVKGLLPSRFPNRQELEAITTVLLGGRAADVIFGKGAHAGAEHDLEMATDMLRKGIEEMGLYGRLTSGTSLIARREVDEQIEEALQRLFKWAMLIVRQESEAVKVIADALLLHRVLDGADLLRIFASHRSGHSLPPVEIEAAGGE